jgi:hypothetical protein
VPYTRYNDTNRYTIFYWKRDDGLLVADTYWVPNEYSGSSEFVFTFQEKDKYVTNNSLSYDGILSIPNTNLKGAILKQSNGDEIIYFGNDVTGTKMTFFFFNILSIETLK